MMETFNEEDIEEIIQDNRDLVNERGDSFGVNKEELDKIFDNVNNFGEIFDLRMRIIKKSAWILGGITFYQPFNDGNKETALSLTIHFLRENDMDLPINSRSDKKEIYELLTKTVLKFEDDPTIISEIEEYLFRKVVCI
ncbi:MAG: Fic family protein [Nitrosarchaeum sp.]